MTQFEYRSARVFVPKLPLTHRQGARVQRCRPYHMPLTSPRLLCRGRAEECMARRGHAKHFMPCRCERPGAVDTRTQQGEIPWKKNHCTAKSS